MRARRLEHMKGFIFSQQHVSLRQLCEKFDVSLNTVRRDLKSLLEDGAVKKVYGGVTAVTDNALYQPYQERTQFRAEAKERIGRCCAGHIQTGDIIAMDTGSTVFQVARHIPPTARVTVITNALGIMNLRAGADSGRLISLGGEFLPQINGFASLETIKMLDTLKCTRTFIGATGIIARDDGITNAPSIETEIKRSMIRIASEVYLVVDSAKFGVVAQLSLGHFSRIDYLVTDSAPDPELAEVLKRNNVRVLVA